MDGVLVDSEPLWRRSEIEVFGSVGLTIDEDDCRKTQGLRIDEAVGFWFQRSPWSRTSQESVAEQIVERVAELIRAEATPINGAYQSIEAARERGFELGLASSSPRSLIQAVLERFDLADTFDAVCSAEHEQFGKPHPAVYLRAASELRVAPESCIAIEDSVNGVISALAARMRCIAIPEAPERDDPRFAVATKKLASLESLGEALDALAREAEESEG